MIWKTRRRHGSPATVVALALTGGLLLTGCPNRTTDGTATTTPTATEVGRETGQRLDSAGMTARVKSALVADPEIGALDLDVTSVAEANTVTITGRVPSARIQTHVTEVAQHAIGDPNVQIVNNTVVQPAP